MAQLAGGILGPQSLSQVTNEAFCSRTMGEEGQLYMWFTWRKHKAS